ncbi:hypothetical protein [Chryseobacterium sp. Marseille-Q8038]
MKKLFYFIFFLLIGFSHAQVKSKTTQKPEKPYVNPVKLTKEERSRPYMSEVLKSRDSLTPQEAERRRKNIELANPFKKYGFYPKIATLSKGKYLEVHDIDSIISIGSVRFNRKTRDIIEFKEIDLSDPDAQPYLDTAGRWFSPDPLSEEFSSWTPYNFAFNNPIKNIDPDGRAAFDWVHNRETNSVYWNPNATSQASAGANETYLGKSGTYTTENGSTTYLYSNGDSYGYTNNSLIGSLGIAPNLDPLIHGGDLAPMMSVAAFGLPSDGSYIRETPSLNTQEGAFANPSAQLASTMLTAMQEAPLAIGGEIAVAKIGQAFNYLTKGGPTFAEYRAAYWANNTKPVLEALENPLTGQTWKQTMELHHRFIPQRAKWAPNWLLNNKVNLQPVNSLEHAIADPYRARFAPKWVKETYNLKWK